MNDFGVQGAFGHHRNFHHIAPPFKDLARGGRAIAKGAVAAGAKADVIRPRFARVQPVMARGAAETADDGIRAQLLAGMAHRTGPVGQVNPVKAQPPDHHQVAVDHQRNVAGMADFAQGIGRAGNQLFVPAGQRQAHTGHGGGIQNLPELFGKPGQLKGRRCQQVKLRLFILRGVLGHCRILPKVLDAHIAQVLRFDHGFCPPYQGATEKTGAR